jgi:hypothetical protein
MGLLKFIKTIYRLRIFIFNSLMSNIIKICKMVYGVMYRFLITRCSIQSRDYMLIPTSPVVKYVICVH